MKNVETKKGFTLVELMVSVTIFSVVMLIAIASLMSINDASKKTEALREVTDSLNFALENMTRTMRLGQDYQCQTGTFGGACAALRFRAYNPDDQATTRELVYSYSNGQITRFEPRTNSSLVLTPAGVNVTELRFNIDRSGVQPRVLVFLKGEIQVKGETTDFAIQTLVSQRQYEQ